MAQGDARPLARCHKPVVRKLKSQVVTATKPHYITGCGCLIKPGDIYVSVVVLIDGKWVYEKHHTHGCLELLH